MSKPTPTKDEEDRIKLYEDLLNMVLNAELLLSFSDNGKWE